MTNPWTPNGHPQTQQWQQPAQQQPTGPAGYPPQQQTQQWQQPAQQQPPAQFYGGSQPRRYGGVEDLRGLNEASFDSRFPELPPGVQVLARVEPQGFKFKSTAYGLKQFTEFTVVDSNNPALRGLVHCTKISGFSDPRIQKYALEDLKALLYALHAPKGMPKTWAGDWIAMGWALGGDGGDCTPVVGTQFMIQSEGKAPSPQSRTGKPWTKYTYTPYM